MKNELSAIWKRIKLLFLLILISLTLIQAQKLGNSPTNEHAIVVNSNGIVYTWGYNSFGQLGNGNTGTNSNVPVAVDMSGVLSGKTITEVAGGGAHTIVLASDGTVYTWGYNSFGQLGNGKSGTGEDKNVPVAVDMSGELSGKTITQVAAGYFHNIVLASDGTVYTWGFNSVGQFGNGNTGTNSNVPVAVNMSGVLFGKTITQVAAGSYHNIVLASDGTVYTWGNNSTGQLGNGNPGINSNVPVAVDMSGVLSGKTITQVAAGYHHNIVLASDGTVYTWGFNNNGELGNGNPGPQATPVAVNMSGALLGKTVTQVAAGGYSCIVLASDGAIYNWGYGADGRLGDGNSTTSNVPVGVTMSGDLSGKTITQVSAGWKYHYVLDSDGTIYSCGTNNYGQLGNGTNSNTSTPVAIDQSAIGALPVELSSFTATAIGNIVNLNWQTATELNNYGFEIERSITDEKLQIINWEKVGFVEGIGNSNSPKRYTFVDKSAQNGNYFYRLKQINFDGKFEYSDVVEVEVNNLPIEFTLSQNYPNPFNPTTSIEYSVPSSEYVSLKVYDVLGNEVATLVNGLKSAGRHEAKFNASSLSTGMYIYRIQAGSFTQVRKMILLK